jgi:hypothetical protein
MPDPAITYTPTTGDVARFLRARTKDTTTGTEYGDFTANTRPTADEVADLIADASASVAAHVGTEIPTDKDWLAQRVVAIRAAMLVELSYFPEQTNGDDTVYTHLADLYSEALASLTSALEDNQADTVRYASVPVVSPTLVATGVLSTTEILP